MIDRRGFLKWLGITGAAAPYLVARAAPTTPSARLADLERTIRDIIDGQPAGLDLRAVDLRDGYTYFRMTHNSARLFPVASCFKVLAVLYYLMRTPQAEWRLDAESAAFRVAVYSNNPLTGDLILDGASYDPTPGNAIQKFNHFLRFTFLLQNGIYNWDWEGSPTTGQSDPAYAPSASRSVRVGGGRFPMDNLFFASDLASVWQRLLTDDLIDEEPQAEAAITETLRLFALSAEDYQSPIERVWGEYVGKDGVIPAADSPVGRVTNDAGILRIGQSGYVLSLMFVGSEYRFLDVLERIIAALIDYEGV